MRLYGTCGNQPVARVLSIAMRSYVARRRDVHAPSRSRKRRFRPLCDDERASGDGAAATTAWAIDRDTPLVVGWTDCGGRLDVSTRTRASLSRRGSAGPRAVGDGAAATRASALDRAARRRPDGLPRPARRVEAHSGDSFAPRSTGPRASATSTCDSRRIRNGRPPGRLTFIPRAPAARLGAPAHGSRPGARWRGGTLTHP